MLKCYIGSRFLLPSGNVVRVEKMSTKGGVASCHYERCQWTYGFRGVEFTQDWLCTFGARIP